MKDPSKKTTDGTDRLMDDVLRRMLSTPPKPHDLAKAKHKQSKQKPAK
jgi:hypothetical protein